MTINPIRQYIFIKQDTKQDILHTKDTGEAEVIAVSDQIQDCQINVGDTIIVDQTCVHEIGIYKFVEYTDVYAIKQ